MLKRTLLLFAIIFLSNPTYAQTNPDNWTLTYGPHGRWLNCVQAMDIDHIVAGGGFEEPNMFCTVTTTTDNAQSPWNVNLDTTLYWLKGLHFPSDKIGYAVGHNGTIVKSTNGGLTWKQKTLTGDLSLRDYTAVYFIDENTGFVVGGNQADEAYQTILKTTDGGDNWITQKDEQGDAWLKAVFFVDENIGYASGEFGTFLKTTDGGENWITIAIPNSWGQRHFNDIHFFNEMEGVVVGGYEHNDSIQTIIKTKDGGENWYMIRDELANWFNGVDFYDNNYGFVVGDNGNLWFSEDAGETWTDINLPKEINDIDDLNDVHFVNAYYGAAVGEYGKILIFKGIVPDPPIAMTGTVTALTETSAKLNGMVDAEGSSAYVQFEYGTSPDNLSNIIALPDSIYGDTPQPVYTYLHDVNPGTYFYRTVASNNGGKSEGEVHRFYLGPNTIPNFSFEYWNSDTADVIQQWLYSGKVEKVVSYDGSIATSIGTNPDTQETISAIFHGIPNNDGLSGGVPFNERPDSLIFHAKFSPAVADSAFFLLMFKKEGNPISQDIVSFTTKNSDEFERLAFPINYIDQTAVPDTVILGIASDNPFAATFNPDNILIIDNISFSGTDLNVPNADMENWGIAVATTPLDWLTSYNQENPDANIERTTDSYAGDYAIIIKNNLDFNQVGNITLGSFMAPYDTPAFPVAAKHHTFHGFMKFLKEGMDTLTLAVSLFKEGELIGNAFQEFTEYEEEYTPFSLPIYYFMPDDVTPDSANIIVSLGRHGIPYGNSKLYLDHLSFDGLQTPDVYSFIEDKNLWTPSLQTLVYPNPSHQQLFIQSNKKLDYISIYNLQGQRLSNYIVNEYNNNHYTVNTQNLPEGIYILELISGDMKKAEKIIIKQ